RVRLLGVTHDITQRKRAAQTLNDRNRQLELAGKAALVGSFTMDIDVGVEEFASNRMHVSPGFAAIYGFPEKTAEISFGDWCSRVHPDDLASFLEGRQQAFAAQNSEYRAEFRIQRPCGTLRWIETRSFIDYDQADHVKRLVGVNIDVTERKRAAEAQT